MTPGLPAPTLLGERIFSPATPTGKEEEIVNARNSLPNWPLLGFLILAVALALIPSVADGHFNGGKPHYELASTSDSRNAANDRNIFPSSTAKIYVNYYVENLPKGARLRAVWWVDRAEGIAENSRITATESTPGAGSFFGAFSYSKPTGGWPVGTYHVDLFIEDRLERAVSFRVVK